MAPLDQEWYDNDSVGAVNRFECAGAFCSDHWVQDRFQASSGQWIRKDEFAHRRSIHRPRRVGHRWAKFCKDGRHRGAIRGGQTVCNLIRIDNAGTERCEGIGNGRFAASNASRQADQCSVVHNGQSMKAGDLREWLAQVQHSDPGASQVRAERDWDLPALPTAKNQAKSHRSANAGSEQQDRR